MSREKISYPDGSWYEGDLSEGKRNGQGTWVRPDGTRYTGHWQNDKPDGQGAINWPDGRKYVGGWRGGKRHGYGTDIQPDGQSLEGEWVDGEFVKEAEIRPHPAEKQFRQNEGKSGYEPKGESQLQGKGFIQSLFDISMREMITPKIIRVLFVIGLAGIGLGAFAVLLSSIFAANITGAGTVIAAIIAIPIGAFVSVIFLRVYLEIIVLLFNIYDQLKEIRKSLNG